MSVPHPDPLTYARSLPPLARPLPHGASSWALDLAQRMADAALRQAITEALAACGGDRVLAAKALDITPQMLPRLAARVGIVTLPGKAGRKPRR